MSKGVAQFDRKSECHPSIDASLGGGRDVRVATNLGCFHGERGDVEQALCVFWSVNAA